MQVCLKSRKEAVWLEQRELGRVTEDEVREGIGGKEDWLEPVWPHRLI